LQSSSFPAERRKRFDGGGELLDCRLPSFWLGSHILISFLSQAKPKLAVNFLQL
jgi:hypothetical protein